MPFLGPERYFSFLVRKITKNNTFSRQKIKKQDIQIEDYMFRQLWYVLDFWFWLKKVLFFMTSSASSSHVWFFFFFEKLNLHQNIIWSSTIYSLYYTGDVLTYASSKDIHRLLLQLKPLLQDSIQKKKSSRSFETTQHVKGPLTWREFCKEAGKSKI